MNVLDHKVFEDTLTRPIYKILKVSSESQTTSQENGTGGQMGGKMKVGDGERRVCAEEIVEGCIRE